MRRLRDEIFARHQSACQRTFAHSGYARFDVYRRRGGEERYRRDHDRHIPSKEDIRRLFEPNEPLNARLKEVGDEYSYSLANKEVGAKVSFVVQEKMDGNANAIYLCKEFANGEPFAVLFGDDVMYTEEGVFPVTKQLIDAYEKTGGAIVGCQHTSEEVARRCGVMIAEKQVDEKITKISGIIEKPTGEMPSNLVSLGRFVLPSDIFDVIERTPKTNGEVYLTDAISILAKEKSAYSCILTQDVTTSATRKDIWKRRLNLRSVTTNSKTTSKSI